MIQRARRSAAGEFSDRFKATIIAAIGSALLIMLWLIASAAEWTIPRAFALPAYLLGWAVAIFGPIVVVASLLGIAIGYALRLDAARWPRRH